MVESNGMKSSQHQPQSGVSAHARIDFLGWLILITIVTSIGMAIWDNIKEESTGSAETPTVMVDDDPLL